MRKNGFEGFYFKQQSAARTLALIPGVSKDGAFVQIITDGAVYHADYPREAYQRLRELRVGGNVFSTRGLQLDLHTSDCSLTGRLSFTGLSPLKSDIMGPFRFLAPECRHSVLSMRHAVNGELCLNGESIPFDSGTGYIEGDSGRSFPRSYMWVHCNDFSQKCSVMASAADIPFAGGFFRGCIAVVWLDGREHRIASYLGARVRRCEPGVLTLTQGKLRLSVCAERQDGEWLFAPKGGSMTRRIRENIACPARFSFYRGDELLFEDSGRTGYEYVSGNEKP